MSRQTLIILENTSDNNDSSQDNTEVKIILSWIIVGVALNWIGQKAKNGTNPQKSGETAKQIATEFNPLGSGLWWSQLVVAVAFQTLKLYQLY